MDGGGAAASFRWRRTAWFVALVMLFTGCARRPYQLGSADRYRVAPELQALTTPQIERGTPRPILDKVGWVIGIPDKITLWDRRVSNHDVSFDTEVALAEYLAANELTAVKVRLNQYAPRDEWHRLRQNKSMAWGWRYTFGTCAWLGDTLFPGRVWGGDHYNPYTNSLYIFSDVPAIALHEGGHAKDFARRSYPGTYAAFYAMVPGAPLYCEAVATRDAYGYLREFGTAEEQREAYVILTPAYGTYVGGAVGDFIPGYGLAAQAAAIVGGHIIGRVRAACVEEEPATATVRTAPQSEILPPITNPLPPVIEAIP